MPDLSNGLENQKKSPALRARDSTNATVVIRAFDSHPAYDPSTALGEAFNKAGASVLVINEFEGGV